jgi:Protein of unknown function (DUF2786)
MTTEREGLLDKIRALLAKTVAAGCTESEALAALSKGRALMDAHCVTEAELKLTKEEKAILRREPRGSKDPTESNGSCCLPLHDSAVAELGAHLTSGR